MEKSETHSDEGNEEEENEELERGQDKQQNEESNQRQIESDKQVNNDNQTQRYDEQTKKQQQHSRGKQSQLEQSHHIKKNQSSMIEESKENSSKIKRKVQTKKQNELWKAYDFLFPGGKLSKLIKITNIYKKNLPVSDMLTKFKYTEAYPVINIIGGMENNRGKFYAGVARAAYNTDAVIITNGIATGLQKFVLRRGVKMIGVAPQKQVKFPKINPTFIEKMQLANGHTHLFLLNNPSKDLSWGGEVEFKIDIALKLAEGKKKGQPNCKIVSLFVGDALFDELQQIKRSVENDFPIIVVPGSPLCDELIKNSSDPKKGSYSNEEMRKLVGKGHFFYCNTTNSEDIAQLVHLLLVIRPW